jgi:hypothetical protein
VGGGGVEGGGWGMQRLFLCSVCVLGDRSVEDALFDIPVHT